MEPERTGPDRFGLDPRKGIAPEPLRGGQRTAAQEPAGRRGAAYTDKPDIGNTGRDRGRKWAKQRTLAAAAAAAMLVAGGLFVVSPGAPNWLRPRPHAAQTQPHTLIFTNNDLDREATDGARAALQRGEVPAELADLPANARREILPGERALFTLRLVDDFNSLVYFHVDGAPVMNWHVSDMFATQLIEAKDNGARSVKVEADAAGAVRVSPVPA